MTTSKRLTKTQKERGEIYEAFAALLEGTREPTKRERDRINQLNEDLGAPLGTLRFVLDERDEADDDG